MCSTEWYCDRKRRGDVFSHQHSQTPASATERHPAIAGAKAQALGVSLVIHPTNPNVPTSHANVRLFVAEPEGQAPIWWFGGGFDLTPFYPNDEDVLSWHQTAFDLCAPFGEEIYAEHKQWCDDYFYLKHRDEQRGIGGLFFDDLNQWDFEKCFEYIQAVANGYLNAILPIFQRNQDKSFTQAQRDFQLYRRGRYVEYNLVYDRGTLFGLQTGGRIESILVSMPPLAAWSYRPEWDENSPEKCLTDHYLKPKDWLSILK